MEFRSRPVGHSKAMKVVSIACILLVGLGLSLQAAHLHVDAKLGPAKNCPICMGAHVALPSTSAQAVVCEAATPAIRIAVETPRHIRFHSFSLYNRPPPPQA